MRYLILARCEAGVLFQALCGAGDSVNLANIYDAFRVDNFLPVRGNTNLFKRLRGFLLF